MSKKLTPAEEARKQATLDKFRSACKHNDGFYLNHKMHLFLCNWGCGYSLNFDPELFPSGVAYIHKSSRTAILLPPRYPPTRK